MKNLIKINEIITKLDTENSKEARQISDKLKSFSSSLIKFSQEIKTENSELADKLSSYLSCLKVNQIFAQTIHWTVRGTNFYGDHLLFERIYNNTLKEIDVFSEKSVALAGSSSVEPLVLLKKMSDKLSELTGYLDDTTSDISETIFCALQIEYFVIEETKELFLYLKKENKLSLGMDDLLTNISNQHEEHIYLIQQRAKE